MVQKTSCCAMLLAALFLVPAISNAGLITTYSPMPEALDALESDGLVTVQETRRYWSFLPTSDQKSVGFIFYTGAFVDERSYAPAMRSLAEEGYPSFLLKLPFDVALLSPFHATYVIRDFEEVDGWVVGGHSLGGVAASVYANHKDNAGDKVVGLALWSSFPTPFDNLSNQDTAVVSFWGTEDGLTAKKDWDGSVDQLPADAEFITIDGGNHAQMGYYGFQDGDNPALITRDEQQDIVVGGMLDLLQSLE